MTDREFAIDVVRRLRQSGYEALWAGGCVRDELLGLAPADYDVATSARPEQVVQAFQQDGRGRCKLRGGRGDRPATRRRLVPQGPGGHVPLRRGLHRWPPAGIGHVFVAARGRAASRLHHQRHVLRPARRPRDRLRRRAGRPAGKGPAGDRRSEAPGSARTSCGCCGPSAWPPGSAFRSKPQPTAAIRADGAADHGRQRRADRGGVAQDAGPPESCVGIATDGRTRPACDTFCPKSRTR